MDEDFQWNANICDLPWGVLKFLFNSVLASLPTKGHSHEWGKSAQQPVTSAVTMKQLIMCYQGVKPCQIKEAIHGDMTMFSTRLRGFQ